MDNFRRAGLPFNVLDNLAAEKSAEGAERRQRSRHLLLVTPIPLLQHVAELLSERRPERMKMIGRLEVQHNTVSGATMEVIQQMCEPHLVFLGSNDAAVYESLYDVVSTHSTPISAHSGSIARVPVSYHRSVSLLLLFFKPSPRPFSVYKAVHDDFQLIIFEPASRIPAIPHAFLTRLRKIQLSAWELVETIQHRFKKSLDFVFHEIITSATRARCKTQLPVDSASLILAFMFEEMILHLSYTADGVEYFPDFEECSRHFLGRWEQLLSEEQPATSPISAEIFDLAPSLTRAMNISGNIDVRLVSASVALDSEYPPEFIFESLGHDKYAEIRVNDDYLSWSRQKHRVPCLYIGVDQMCQKHHDFFGSPERLKRFVESLLGIDGDLLLVIELTGEDSFVYNEDEISRIQLADSAPILSAVAKALMDLLGEIEVSESRYPSSLRILALSRVGPEVQYTAVPFWSYITLPQRKIERIARIVTLAEPGAAKTVVLASTPFLAAVSIRKKIISDFAVLSKEFHLSGTVELELMLASLSDKVESKHSVCSDLSHSGKRTLIASSTPFSSKHKWTCAKITVKGDAPDKLRTCEQFLETIQFQSVSFPLPSRHAEEIVRLLSLKEKIEAIGCHLIHREISVSQSELVVAGASRGSIEEVRRLVFSDEVQASLGHVVNTLDIPSRGVLKSLHESDVVTTYSFSEETRVVLPSPSEPDPAKWKIRIEGRKCFADQTKSHIEKEICNISASFTRVFFTVDEPRYAAVLSFLEQARLDRGWDFEELLEDCCPFLWKPMTREGKLEPLLEENLAVLMEPLSRYHAAVSTGNQKFESKLFPNGSNVTRFSSESMLLLKPDARGDSSDGLSAADSARAIQLISLDGWKEMEVGAEAELRIPGSQASLRLTRESVPFANLKLKYMSACVKQSDVTSLRDCLDRVKLEALTRAFHAWQAKFDLLQVPLAHGLRVLPFESADHFAAACFSPQHWLEPKDVPGLLQLRGVVASLPHQGVVVEDEPKFATVCLEDLWEREVRTHPAAVVFMLFVARFVSKLHQRGRYHGDVSARNFLVLGESFKALPCGVVSGDIALHRSSAAARLGIGAVDLLQEDIFALGILIWEVCKSRQAQGLAEIKEDPVGHEKLDPLILSCLSEDPEKRPKAKGFTRTP